VRRNRDPKRGGMKSSNPKVKQMEPLAKGTANVFIANCFRRFSVKRFVWKAPQRKAGPFGVGSYSFKARF
jgi:hypothetical protein